MSPDELKAPAGKFRVVGVDAVPVPPKPYVIGDYLDFLEARRVAQETMGSMHPCFVFSDAGKLLFSTSGADLT